MKRIGTAILAGLFAFFCRLVVALVLLLVVLIASLALPFVGTRVVGVWLGKTLETLTRNPL